MPATMSCRAAENYFWVSANNSQARAVSLGQLRRATGRADLVSLKLHRPDILLTDAAGTSSGLF